MMSSYYESLFNRSQQTNSNSSSFLFPSLFYPPSISSSLFFQSDTSFRLYHEAFIRNIFDRCCQPLPSSLLLTPSIALPTVSMESQSDLSLTNENYYENKTATSSVSNGKVRRRLSCSQCSYTTNRLNNLKRHVQTMHEILPEPIDCCDQLFISKAHFRAHVNAEHRCGYHCDTCQRSFCRKALLRRHQSVHSGQKAFTCPVCVYSTSHKGNLDRHMRIHRYPNENRQF